MEKDHLAGKEIEMVEVENSNLKASLERRIGKEDVGVDKWTVKRWK